VSGCSESEPVAEANGGNEGERSEHFSIQLFYSEQLGG
jgi:hypothetical protein